MNTKTSMPLGMILISSLYLLSALGYIFATILQATGVLSFQISLGARLLGVLKAVLWIACAFCIFKRLRWGWHVGLFLVGYEILGSAVLMAFPFLSATPNPRSALIELVISLVVGVYLYSRKGFFMPPKADEARRST